MEGGLAVSCAIVVLVQGGMIRRSGSMNRTTGGTGCRAVVLPSSDGREGFARQKAAELPQEVEAGRIDWTSAASRGSAKTLRAPLL